MQYLGGKFRIRHLILDILRKFPSNYYLEPFCGSCWVGECLTDKVRIFSDYHYGLIELLKMCWEYGWVPPTEVSEEMYQHAKTLPEGATKAFIGFALSWGGKYFSGYARGTQSNGNSRNYAKNCSNQFTNRAINFKDVRFKHSHYSKMFQKLLLLKERWIVYCDPPYSGTTQYYGLPKFNHDNFWKNVKAISNKHYVVVSEYTAPEFMNEVASFKSRTDISFEEREDKLFATGLAYEFLKLERDIEKCDRELATIKTNTPKDIPAYLTVLGEHDWLAEKKLLLKEKEKFYGSTTIINT